jgi:hypothetical protein
MHNGKCKLCLQHKRLAQSHLMPRALYDMCSLPGIDPILITSEVVMPVSRHTKDYVLCFDCEQLLNRNGENWMIPRLLTIQKSFPFYDALSNRTPDIYDPEMAVYATAYIPQIDVNCVLHFGMGLFWKASVHSWKGGERDPSINLGPYSEKVRTFLLGDTTFPTNIKLFVTVSRPADAVMGFTPPYEGTRESTWRNFLCYVPGIEFGIAVGKLIPRALTIFSFSENSSRPLFIWDKMPRNLRNLNKSIYLKAHKTRSFHAQRKRRSGVK